MRRDLSATFAMAELADPTNHLDKLLFRVVMALDGADVSMIPTEDGVSVCHENNQGQTTYLNISMAKGSYSISDEFASPVLSALQKKNGLGQTDDYDTFIGALEYLITIHNPSKVDEISSVMAQFRMPQEPASPAPAQPKPQ